MKKIRKTKYDLSENEKHIVDDSIRVLREHRVDDIDFTGICGITPYRLKNYLKDLGYHSYDNDSNGWQQDTWYYFEHKETGEKLIMFYSGIEFELRLHLAENYYD